MPYQKQLQQQRIKSMIEQGGYADAVLAPRTGRFMGIRLNLPVKITLAVHQQAVAPQALND